MEMGCETGRVDTNVADNWHSNQTRVRPRESASFLREHVCTTSLTAAQMLRNYFFLIS